jgi:hypothetical protein
MQYSHLLQSHSRMNMKTFALSIFKLLDKSLFKHTIFYKLLNLSQFTSIRLNHLKTLATLIGESSIYNTDPSKRKSFSKLPLFLLLYICINLHVCSAAYSDTAPITTLGIIPTCIGTSLLVVKIPSYIQHFTIPSTKLFLPQPTLTTGGDKLPYLSAWTSLHANQKLRLMNFSPGGQPICVDSGASCCISNNWNDFTTFQSASNRVHSGITNCLEIEGTGTLCWRILNDNGDKVQLHSHNSLYVPSLPMNLLSPQQICQQTKHLDDGFVVGASHGTLCFANHQCTIYYNHTKNLPILFTSSQPTSLHKPTTPFSSTDTSTLALLSSENTNTCSPLSGPQCHLLRKHQQLGHLHKARIQQLARDGVLGPSYKNIANCDLPICPTCLQGKQHRTNTTPLTSPGHIDNNHLMPGMCVSGDQLESSTPGLIPTFQASPTSQSYRAGTLFIDHTSRYLFFTPHLSTDAQAAIAAKHCFELHAISFHRAIKCYHTDMGVFCSKAFRDSCSLCGQGIRYSGVNAHHQNGIDKRYIHTITERARTMLIHAMVSWPEIVHENLWPFALRLAVAIHNATPGPTGLSPD